MSIIFDEHFKPHQGDVQIFPGGDELAAQFADGWKFLEITAGASLTKLEKEMDFKFGERIVLIHALVDPYGNYKAVVVVDEDENVIVGGKNYAALPANVKMYVLKALDSGIFGSGKVFWLSGKSIEEMDKYADAGHQIIAKIVDLDLKYNLGIQNSELPNLVAHFGKSEKSFSMGEDAWLDAMNKLIEQDRMNPLMAEVRKKDVAINKLCLVCKKEATAVTLMGGRKAYYCASHKVAIPEAVE